MVKLEELTLGAVGGTPSLLNEGITLSPSSIEIPAATGGGSADALPIYNESHVSAEVFQSQHVPSTHTKVSYNPEIAPLGRDWTSYKLDALVSSVLYDIVHFGGCNLLSLARREKYTSTADFIGC